MTLTSIILQLLSGNGPDRIQEKDMIKLIKKQDEEWLGNGLGNQAAQWVVKGAEHIELWKGSTEWNITNTQTGKRIGRWLDTRAAAVTLLEALVAEGELSI